jgi:putative endonuclease
MHQSDTGLLAEALCTEYLKSKGYGILDHNWAKKWGELDIISKKDNILVFIEVKAGKSVSPGFEPFLRAGFEKLQKVARTARTYMAQKHYPSDQEWQIDVISVIIDEKSKKANFTHFKNVDIY